MKPTGTKQSASDRLLERLERNTATMATSKIINWDDGFTPSGCNGAKGRMVIDQPRSKPGLVAIREDVVPKSLAQSIYASAIEAGVWGEYINLKEIDDLLRSNNSSNANIRRQLAAQAVHSFFRETFADLVRDDWEVNNSVHGVSVWVIASGVGDSVQYHIDYAEMFRFQTNTIYPPMYGGTLHLTNTTNMEGGGFFVHRDGLEHYRTFKYKCPLDRLGWDGKGIGHKSKDGPTEQSHTTSANSNWVEVPYKYNQGTLCDGDLPHFSAPVRSIGNGLKRVIVGFNVCNHEVGPIVQEFPEHSAKFNRFVKLSQTASKATLGGGGLTVEACKSNPKLAAFVKLLARKIKETEAKNYQQQNRSKCQVENLAREKHEASGEKAKPENPHETEKSKET